jgi:hypothetical protein
MNAIQVKLKSGLLACAAALLASSPVARAENGITAVYSRASDDYVRATQADGSVQNEAYAFGNGGFYSGALKDDTIDNLGFTDIAHTLAAPLAAQNFLPARDPNKTKLLIMVYWGATTGPQDFAQSNFSHGPQFSPYLVSGGLYDMSIRGNANLLGYAEELNKTGIRRLRLGGDLADELGTSRYFVVLMAYDFQMMWKEKKHKLLWESRFSVREQGNDFTRALPAMAEYAAQYFGRDSHGLLRTHVPDGRIDMGDPTVIEFLTGEPVRRTND